MSLELLDPESQQLYTELKATVMEHAEKVAITFDALVRIRDGRLYRAEFKTFALFCESVGMNTRKAYRLLEDKARKPKRIAGPKTEPMTQAVRDALREDDMAGEAALMLEAKEAMSNMPLVSPVLVPMTAISGPDAEAKVAAMMQKLSLKPVIDVRAEQYRTHTPIPPMDRPEEKPVSTLDVAEVMGALQAKAIAATELKAWAAMRRAMNDATSEDDAAWADYIAQQILL